MTLRVLIEGRPVDLEFDRNGEQCHFRLRAGPTEASDRTASLVEVSPAVYSVLLDGRSYEVRVEPGSGRWFVAVQGRRFSVEVVDPRRSQRKAGGVFGEGRQSISSPMPGKVIRLLAAPGEHVEAGQGLLVVEAMKMQNEMKAPKAGTVVSMNAREGATVAAGEVLATIE